MGVGLAQSVWRQATGWTSGVQFPAEEIFFCFLERQTGSRAHPASYPVEVKLPECETDHSSSSSAEVKNGGAVPPLTPYDFMT
jgi:hypothetical protein